EEETEILVTEMGMRGLGQITDLCQIARPEIALVSHIGPEHLELLGSVERVAQANAEAIDALPSGGTAVVPARARELEPHLLRDDVEFRRFDPDDVTRLDDGGRFRFLLQRDETELGPPYTPDHQPRNNRPAIHVPHK